jgi:hypothetical protein
VHARPRWWAHAPTRTTTGQNDDRNNRILRPPEHGRPVAASLNKTDRRAYDAAISGLQGEGCKAAEYQLDNG